MEQPKIEFRQVRDFGEVINDTFIFLKQNYKPLLKSVFFISILFVVANIIFSTINLYYLQKTMNLYGRSFGREVVQRSYLSTALIMLFAMITYYVISLCTYSYINIYVEKKGETPTLEEVWSYSKYHALRYLWGNFIIIIILLLGLILCVIPFFYLWPILNLALSVIVLDNANVSYSISRSFKLIKQSWWMSFGTIIILTVIYYACTLAIQLPLAIVGAGANFFIPKLNEPLYLLFIKSILASLSHFIIIIPTIGTSLLFFSLVEKKESEGLFERIESIGIEKTQTNNKDEEY
jgi:hypothetical protein